MHQPDKSNDGQIKRMSGSGPKAHIGGFGLINTTRFVWLWAIMNRSGNALYKALVLRDVAHGEVISIRFLRRFLGTLERAGLREVARASRKDMAAYLRSTTGRSAMG